jgi:glucose-1-phosphate thymidylyltransferase long form
MKGLIPAAGMGKRLEPITHAIPKELLMVGDKAIIEYGIDAMKQIGIRDITIVVGWRKHAIIDYLGSGERLGLNISYVVQDKRDGLGKAVYAGKHIIGDDIFLVVLGDNFFYPKTFLKEISEFHNDNNADATIGVIKIEDPTRHGIIKPGDDNRIIDFIEKPSKSMAPSNLGAIGIYLFNKNIFEAIDKTKPGYNNEIQLTDAIKILIDEDKKVLYKEIIGHHIDIGTIQDLKKANSFILNKKIV